MEDFTADEWERLRSECEDRAALRDEGFRSVVKNTACHHFDVCGDFLVGRWVAVAEIIDELGDRHLTVLGSQNLEPWEAVGLVAGIGMA